MGHYQLETVPFLNFSSKSILNSIKAFTFPKGKRLFKADFFFDYFYGKIVIHRDDSHNQLITSFIHC